MSTAYVTILRILPRVYATKSGGILIDDYYDDNNDNNDTK
jgi:hypothetical protein